jgi:hypothetical protein
VMSVKPKTLISNVIRFRYMVFDFLYEDTVSHMAETIKIFCNFYKEHARKQ